MKLLRSFLFGAAAYPALEILWRGRTHYSMSIAGGLSMALIRGASKLPGGILRKAFVCGVGITGIEYACGKLWNKDYRVWDYRNQPLNIQGQICLPYSMLWCGLSGAVLCCITSKRRKTPFGR